MKVGVVGAGIFGLVIATEFASRGAQVILLEQRTRILDGCTSGSVLRVHQGPHYPRHAQTAIQSRDNYHQFVDRFNEFIDFNYENFYSISRRHSKTSTSQFEDFIRMNRIEAERINDSYLKQEFGVDTKKLSGTWSCREGVLGIDSLRTYFLRLCLELGVEVILNCEVSSAKISRGKWSLSNKELNLDYFDCVIQATYGMDNINFSPALGHRELLFQRTLVLETEDSTNYGLGLTIMDGDFLTILPKAFSTNHFLYSPKASVLDSVVADRFPKDWKKEISKERIEFAKNEILKKYRIYFPENVGIAISKCKNSFRALEISSGKNDARTSEWRYIAPNFIQVLSGKIDHSLGLAKSILHKSFLK